MDYQLTSKDRVVALRIVAIYAFVSGLWIYTSDELLGLLIRDPALIVRYSVYKGLAFIVVTVALLYHLIADYTRQCRRAEEALNQLNAELESRVTERTRELQFQNRELQEAYLGLEKETAKRMRTVEELRLREQMLVQQSRMAAMGEVLVNIAHHWRQPLNVIGLKVQEVGLSCELDGFSEELLKSRVAEVMAMLQQLSQTIDEFGQLSAPDLERRRFSVGHAFDQMLSLVRDGFREAGIAIEKECGEQVEIRGFPNDFTHVLMAIVMNARDVFEESPVSDARIMMRCWSEPGRTVVTITDNAGGISEGVIDRIFDPYFTTKQGGNGRGIGLFMAKTVVEKRMGGRLSVRNVQGGAEFRIEV
ncbi:sensor histidine kinase [Geomonas sp.]|uniref:sensor histidine kinase n=1 Tax=Geomonas sp. TaxID=2651584 RepID=UPI002B483110|nr:ATP-binding protein [Geomonas sp.]HJV36454.1 ATP-binding protein [Geomonas sp.]